MHDNNERKKEGKVHNWFEDQGGIRIYTERIFISCFRNHSITI